MKKTLFLLLLMPATLFGQVVDPIKINTLIDSKSKLTSAKEGYQYFDLNREAFNEGGLVKGAHFLFEIEPGVIEELIVTRVSEFIKGTYSIIARKDGESLNEFSLSYSEGKIIGSYHRNSNETLYLGYQQEVASNYISNKPIEEPIYNKGNDEILAPNYSQSLPNKNKSALQPQTMVPNVEAMANGIDDITTIDVMLVYTEAAEDWAISKSSTIGNVLAQAMNKSQLALDNSNTGIELRLVHQYKTSYDERIDGLESSEVRLRRITRSPSLDVSGDAWDDTNNYMNEVHGLRDQYGADLVGLIAYINDTGGIAWRLGSTTGSAEFAFSVNRAQQIAFGYTLIHEFGHNMGNAHSRTQQDTLSRADGSGGLFQYSAGYQDKSNNFHTIMAYSDGLVSAPIFSSPNLSYSGKQAGTNNMFTPEDNARSMSEIKTVIAGYRSSFTNPPILSSITNAINIEMDREDEHSVPINITNTGSSRLMWFSDFDFLTNTVNKLKSSQQNSEYKLKISIEDLDYPANASFTDKAKEKNSDESTDIYSTSFENSEDFALGEYKAISQWRSLRDDKSVIISDENSKTGNNHLRLKSNSNTETLVVSSPFFGAQPFGTYEVEMGVAISGSEGLKERFDIYIYDGKNGEIAAGIVVSGGQIYAMTIGEDGETSFTNTNTFITLDIYKNFKISFDVNTETVSYYYGGQVIASRSFFGGRTPGQVLYLHGNELLDTTLDIDNLKITRLQNAYSWLSINTYGGSINPSASQDTYLTFNTRGIAAGNYETKLIIQSNDPNKTRTEIPINLKVSTAISDSEIPKSIVLKQNYPNPFNPETIITFVLNEEADVRLEIFTIQGQKVETLVNENLKEGRYEAVFNAEKYASGVYLYRLSTPNRSLTRKMTLIK